MNRNHEKYNSYHLQLWSCIFRVSLKRYMLFILLLNSTFLSAQDMHFSQFFTNPMIFNPANTGYFNGNYRLGANYRAQWPFAVQGKFVTFQNYDAFADFSFLEKLINKIDFAGIGIYALNDQAGDGNLRTSKFNISLAYHKGLEKHNRYMLSGGFGFTMVNRALDFKKLYFNNQWTGRDFNTGLPNGEPIQSQNAWYYDLSAGLMLRMGFSEKYSLSAGASLFHINRPKDTFYGSNNRIGMKTVGQLSFHAQLSQETDLSANFIFAYQKKAIEACIGILAGYGPVSYRKEPLYKLYAGAYYRTRDAFIPMIGGQLGPVRILASYDFTVSKLVTYNSGVGAFELSLSYTGKFPRQGNNIKKVYCPKF